MTTLIVGGLCLLLAHAVSEWLERKREARLDDHAADLALYAIDPEFAAEMGYTPTPPMSESARRGLQGSALGGILAGLAVAQQDMVAMKRAQAHDRDYESHLASQHRLAAMLQNAPPNAHPGLAALMQNQPHPGPNDPRLALLQQQANPKRIMRAPTHRFGIFG